MPYTMPRIVVSALSGGSGKTMLSVGLARALTRRGLRVQCFKKGPDYIDTLWASLASGLPPRNLDPFMSPPGSLPRIFRSACQNLSPAPDLAIIEGNRGLFDGLDLAGSCSTAELARQLGAPVLLAVNCTKMTRTTAALVKGCKDFEEDLNIGGVVLNQVTRGRHRAIVTEAVEILAATPVLGVVPRLPVPPFEERYSGLLAGEALRAGPESFARLDDLADLIEASVDLDAVLAMARSAPPLELPDFAPCSGPSPASAPGRAARPRIGYARDQALWFYYTENLEALEAAGAELVPVALLCGADWPDLDGLYLGGGTPEDYLAELAAGAGRKELLRAMVERGQPVYAEGGALYYLGREVRKGGASYPMAGIFDYSVEITPAPQGLGYVQGRVEAPNPYHPAGAALRAHEFNYARLTMPESLLASALIRLDKGLGLGRAQGANWDGLLKNNCYASSLQVYAPGAPDWAANFVRLAGQMARR
ncbi:cobyrinate a,c-diamide synthase [Desulfovibrio sp. OttesenSCG-928-C14]|nr:cobyrinate a,c-diamide synthase [Desulfovibrio sp. OttesenSCG-928-C14]